MSSDRARHVPDTAFRGAGTGMYARFQCAACAKPKSVAGRRLKRVHGVRQWVCKERSK